MIARPARFDLVVRDGLVAAGDATVRADIGIRDGCIRAVAERLEDTAQIVEAKGRLVLPGGVDAHCHMDQPNYGAVCADDFRSGTLSAACGGTTTIVPFAMAHASDPVAETVAAYRRRAEGQALIDYAIHPTIQAASAQTLEQDLPALIRNGYASLKIFTTYDDFRLGDAEILAIFKVAAQHGALVMVHAENDAIIAMLKKDLLSKGLVAPRFHAKARPPIVESEAIHRIASFAELTGAEVLIVHVSSRVGLEEVMRARARGVSIHAETCPQYLLLTEKDLDREIVEGAKFMCSPPLRTVADQEALWAGMARGDLAIYSSDHSPYRLTGPGKLQHGPQSRFDQIANGMPGLELRQPLLFSEGYLKGRISLAQFIALSSTNAAELHGIAPQKGSIAIGADGDLAIWDQERETTVTPDLLHDNTGHTPYEGIRIRGWPVTTIARGEVIVDDGRVLGTAGRGRFVPSRARVAS
ncbi:Phenylhydantoinase [Mesorhizobium metallidurans STM 2683]|uniref:Phenylhydantoinase n=1 Tax=Mesorhizobium metallidurans STM 2683 TaxID=1297569 RepID=M5EIF5_9HYPH|nr:dihydropyrimidinase [Mesorhizobium metallidurans]CCV03858.1 Phenylhydantoinase [Mesorhizobium metallidurans STM 2683]